MLTNAPRRSALTAAFLLFCTAFTGACFSEPKPECAFACPANGQCPEEYRCVSDGWCKRNDIPVEFQCSPASLIDGATFDSGRADSAVIDANVPDADLSDAAPVDADTTDADTTDADTTDADTTDADTTDADTTDADTTDADPPDAMPAG